MPSLLTLLLPVVLGLVAVLAGSVVAGRLAWLAAIAYGLGAASIRVALRLPLGGAADPLWVGALPIASLRIDAGLQLLGVLLAAGAAALAWTGEGSLRNRAAALGALMAAIAMVACALPLLVLAGWPQALAAAIALGAGFGLVGAVLVGVTNRLWRAAPSGKFEPGSHFPRAPGRAMSSLLGVGAIATIAAPHLHLVAGGAIVAAIAATRIAQRGGATRVPVFPAVATAALAFVAYYLGVIAGPFGVSLAVLPDAPLSTAAQALIVPVLALGAAGFFGLWPLTALTPGTWLAPVGVALLVRIGVASLPLGMDGWRTVAIPIGVLAAWAAALGRRPRALAAAGAWMACFAAPISGVAAAWLLGLVPVLGMHPGAPDPDRASVRRSLLRNLVIAAVGTLGATLALDALLRTEVVYAVLATAAAAFSAVYISRART